MSGRSKTDGHVTASCQHNPLADGQLLSDPFTLWQGSRARKRRNRQRQLAEQGDKENGKGKANRE